MGLILGMDIGVFLAWIGTIIVAFFCVLYGLYHHFFRKSDEKPSSKRKSKTSKEED